MNTREKDALVRVVPMPQAFDHLQLRSLETLENAEQIVLQTRRSPCALKIAERFPNAIDLDDIYESAPDFDRLYEEGASRIAARPGAVFCSLGDPRDNGFIDALGRIGREIELAGTWDGVAEALARIGPRARGNSYAAYGARDLEKRHLDTGAAVAVTDIDDRFTASEVKLILGEYYPPDFEIFLYENGRVTKTNLCEFEADRDWGSGAVLIAPPLALEEKTRFSYHDLLSIMERLRAPGGCPWDAEQTHDSLRPCLIEEAYEVADAVREDDMHALYDELGDVLLQVVFHAQIGKETGEFDDRDVTTAVCEKMIRRHPHVFGTVHVENTEEVLKNWDQIKRSEKKERSYTDSLADVPKGMSALIRAAKIQKKAANVGFDWPSVQGALQKVHEELREFETETEKGAEGRVREEGGDLLFAVVNALRLAHVDPETALEDTSAKFIRRFAYMEEHAQEDLANLSLEEQDRLWNAAKEQEAESGS